MLTTEIPCRGELQPGVGAVIDYVERPSPTAPAGGQTEITVRERREFPHLTTVISGIGEEWRPIGPVIDDVERPPVALPLGRQSVIERLLRLS